MFLRLRRRYVLFTRLHRLKYILSPGTEEQSWSIPEFYFILLHSYIFDSHPSARQLRRLANADLVESPNRRPYPPTTLFKYPTPNIPTTSLTPYRRGLLEMEWKRGAAGVFTCTSILLILFSLPSLITLRKGPTTTLSPVLSYNVCTRCQLMESWDDWDKEIRRMLHYGR